MTNPDHPGRDCPKLARKVPGISTAEWSKHERDEEEECRLNALEREHARKIAEQAAHDQGIRRSHAWHDNYAKYIDQGSKPMPDAPGRPPFALSIPPHWIEKEYELTECRADNGDIIEFHSRHDEGMYLVIRTADEEIKKRRITMRLEELQRAIKEGKQTRTAKVQARV